MSMHKSGRNDAITPGASCDLKLADYINRKSKHDALMNSKPTISFEEWYNKNFIANRINGMCRRDHLELKEAMELCWNASRENS